MYTAPRVSTKPGEAQSPPQPARGEAPPPGLSGATTAAGRPAHRENRGWPPRAGRRHRRAFRRELGVSPAGSRAPPSPASEHRGDGVPPRYWSGVGVERHVAPRTRGANGPPGASVASKVPWRHQSPGVPPTRGSAAVMLRIDVPIGRAPTAAVNSRRSVVAQARRDADALVTDERRRAHLGGPTKLRFIPMKLDHAGRGYHVHIKAV